MLEITYDGPLWDTETDPANPQPQVFPKCSTCEAAYVYRRGLSLSKGTIWYWSRDCKHKSEATIHVPLAEGRTEAEA